MSKIIPRIFGGLGNQLFCYAAARRLALTTGAELAIDDVSGFVWDTEYRRQYQLHNFAIPCRSATAAERLQPLDRLRRYLKRKWNQRLPFEQRRYIQQEGVAFDERLLRVKPSGTVYLEGYWQSEDYFKDVANVIRADLRITPPTDAENQQMAARIRDSVAVAVHVRFFDAPERQGVNNAPRDYYASAIEQMAALVPDAHYFLFSDNTEAALARLKLSAARVTCVSHNRGDAAAHADLWLMSQCRHFIIANSTFSWWGAWLGEAEGTRVIAPSFTVAGAGKVTSWGFTGLLPERWIRI